MPWTTLLNSDTLILLTCIHCIFRTVIFLFLCSSMSSSTFIPSVLGKVEGGRAPDFLVHLLKTSQIISVSSFHRRKIARISFQNDTSTVSKVDFYCYKTIVSTKLKQNKTKQWNAFMGSRGLILYITCENEYIFYTTSLILQLDE